MKYTEKQIDSLVLMAIKKISEHPAETFKPRPMTIASFLKGTKHSPYYSYYSHYPSLCGSIILTAGQANSSCKRLVKDGKIKKVKENKSFHYEPCGVQLFNSRQNKQIATSQHTRITSFMQKSRRLKR